MWIYYSLIGIVLIIFAFLAIKRWDIVKEAFGIQFRVIGEAWNGLKRELKAKSAAASDTANAGSAEPKAERADTPGESGRAGKTDGNTVGTHTQPRRFDSDAFIDKVLE